MFCPKFCNRPYPRNQRAQGRPGARCTRGLACVLHKSMLHTSIQVQRRTPGLPCAMALRLIRDRPGDPAFCDTIALGQRWLPSNLTPASGRRTQTISPYATDALVFRTIASTAPCPVFATTADAPLVGQDGGSPTFDLPDGASDLFSIHGLDMISENQKCFARRPRRALLAHQRNYGFVPAAAVAVYFV